MLDEAGKRPCLVQGVRLRNASRCLFFHGDAVLDRIELYKENAGSGRVLHCLCERVVVRLFV